MANPETLLGEIEAKTRELIGTVPERLGIRFKGIQKQYFLLPKFDFFSSLDRF